MLLEILAGVMVLFSVIPAALFCVNLRRYRRPKFGKVDPARVAVLIPARDEERNIEACLRSVLKSEEVELEVFVLDDDSADRTIQIVLGMVAEDRRVTLLHSSTLPRGWNGKQHACWELAHHTTAPTMLFLDADVRLEPWALNRCMATQQAKGVALLSGFPRQITVGLLEKMLLPMIHFVLLSYLPLGRMRKSTKPEYAAGCGQFLLVEREAYFASGGHGAMRETRHDGLRLPKLFREHGYKTDLVDLTAFAEVRMYYSARSVWQGLAKNATEGIAAPSRIVPFSLLLFVGQVLPLIAAVAWVCVLVSTVIVGATFDDPTLALVITLCVLVSLFASYMPRLLAVGRFKQSLLSAFLHPLGVVMLLTVQWYALTRQMMGKPVGWRARKYSSASGSELR